MSRVEFRAAVEGPRPASAWVMVSVASATLWITEQLDAWVLALQPLALVASLLLRTRPLRWQRSPWVLNGLLVVVLLVTGFIATRRLPSTIALAHFACLAQALQLFDVRPRRSEYLLVVLALFQVVLASTLTDSVFFPPLLVAFVFAATWTLLVHTLRTEAQEAGEPAAAARAITPALGRTTAVAGTASLLVALLLFVSLPRMRSSMIGAGGLGTALAASGFSDRVELGSLGRIRKDPTVVLRVETLEGTPPPPAGAYWRGLAFDTFDGRVWSITPAVRAPVIGSPEVGVRFGPGGEEPDLVQRVVREPVEAGVVFVAGRPLALQGTPRRLERDVNQGIYAPLQARERLRYRVALALPESNGSDAALARDRAAVPRPRGARYLTLPPLDPEVAALARRITAGAETDAARARALERWLRTEGKYSDTPPQLSPEDPRSPVEVFLLGGAEGHCEYFASAMVVMARSLGLPARLVNGFAGGRANPIGGFVEVARSDAHAWVEVHFERHGWVRFDPTPPDLRLRSEVVSLGERLAMLGSALELWWFQRVVGFDRSDQMRAMRAAWRAWRGDRRAAAGGRQERRRSVLDWRPDWAEQVPWRAIGAAVVLGLFVAAALRAGSASRRAPDPVPPAYRQALRWLARRGLERAPDRTARAFAREVAVAFPAAAEAFEQLTESYLRVRFGGATVTDEPWSAQLVAMSTAISHTR